MSGFSSRLSLVRSPSRCRSSPWSACRRAPPPPAERRACRCRPGFWATSAWISPLSRSSICLGPASNPTILTSPLLPASRTPVAEASAENRLVPKMPARSGWRVRGDRRRLGRVVVVVFHADVVEAEVLGLSSKPCARASVVEMRVHVVDEDLALAADQVGQRLGRLAAAGLVVRRLRHGHVGLLERGVDEHDRYAGVGGALSGRTSPWCRSARSGSRRASSA